MGKTTLALRYAHDNVDASRLVWWIRADTADSITADLAELARRIRGGHGPADQTMDDAAVWAVTWLQAHPGWLLVFDNAMEPAEIHRVIGQLRQTGRFLITTRLQRGWNTTLTPLPVLEPEAAQRLLKGLAGVSEDDVDEARALAEDLGYLPLALRQAGAYIAQTRHTVAHYRELFASRPGRMMSAAPGTDPDRTLARVWRITLDVLQEREPRAVDVLRVIARYAPTGVPCDLIEPYVDDPLDLPEILGLLDDYNMISYRGPAVDVHRMVQMMARTPEPDDPHRTEDLVAAARDRAVDLLLAALPADPEDDAWKAPVWRRNLPHVEALFDKTRAEPDNESTARLAARTGRFLRTQGRRRSALDLLKRATSASARILGEEDPSTLVVKRWSADAYREFGEFDRAVRLAESVVEDFERTLGATSPETRKA
ncbi:tetratricopeptide repeat protein [Streptomyces sp. NPDC020192]|uniref:tetratricopeptide repeat protein n=1 Tax=Streptomyces sp. NPDC020192 TaxID=3365066 RepID=UPI003794F18B